MWGNITFRQTEYVTHNLRWTICGRCNWKYGEMNGSWAWLQFHNAPWEGDSQYYRTTLAAIAIGSAPGNYKSEPQLQDSLKRLRGYLLKNMDTTDCR